MRGEPFVPKHIYVSECSQYDTPPGIYEQAVRIDCRHVTRIPVTSPPGQNGPGSPH
jgi:hypothetical protein